MKASGPFLRQECMYEGMFIAFPGWMIGWQCLALFIPLM